MVDLSPRRTWLLCCCVYSLGYLNGYIFSGDFFDSAPAADLHAKQPQKAAGVGSEEKEKEEVLLIFPESQDINANKVNSIPGTTGSGIPGALRILLNKTDVAILEDADTDYGSEGAVKILEASCAWDPAMSLFKDPTCLSDVKFDSSTPELVMADPHLMDIVIPSIRNLDFLEHWREFFQGFHVIIIQDGDPAKILKVPEWVDYELYNRHDIQKALGEQQWIISSKDASIRNFGFLVSGKPYIYTIDDDCLPAKDEHGFKINPLALHLRNLRSPSTPYFFNTLYDPYVNGSDFVRGYPYSLRMGVDTAISHGLWLNAPDYDAPTQLLKPRERNTRYLDVTLTVPAGQLYPMCSMNVAFARELVGPAFMQGLMGDGQPWARYDDMFAGWASKVVADHLHLGVKSGQPYIKHDKASNPFTNLKKEWKGLWWQEELIRFFHTVKISKKATTAAEAYRDLAKQLETKCSHLHPYFKRLTHAMTIWTEVWQRVGSGLIKFVPSQRAMPGLPPLNLGGRSESREMPTLASDQLGFQVVSPASTPELTMLSTVSGTDAQLERAAKKTGPLMYHSNLLQSMESAKTSITCEEDRKLGHSWKTYVYPLPAKFNIDPLREYMLKYNDTQHCLLKPCAQKELSKLEFQYTDYEAEVIILFKLLAALDFTDDPVNADLFLVPALPSIYLHEYMTNRHRCSERRNCSWFDDLWGQLQYFNESGSSHRHLFLMSQDQWTMPFKPLSRMVLSGTYHFVASLGPGSLVIPSLNTESQLQPALAQPRSYAERRIFLLAQFGVRNSVRKQAADQLLAYNGSKTVITSFGKVMNPNFKDDPGYIADAILNLCVPGDLPYQKRFFDTLLNGGIPVVITRKEGDRKTYWVPNKHFDQSGSTSVDRAYPTVTGAGGARGIDSYSDIVVEVGLDVLESGQLMQYLESIPQETLLKKMELIQRNRMLFGYDLEGRGADAVTVLLRNIAHKLAPR